MHSALSRAFVSFSLPHSLPFHFCCCQEGNTPLMFACRKTHLNGEACVPTQCAVNALLSHRADACARNAQGFSALTWAVQYRKTHAQHHLLMAGYNIAWESVRYVAWGFVIACVFVCV